MADPILKECPDCAELWNSALARSHRCPAELDREQLEREAATRQRKEFVGPTPDSAMERLRRQLRKEAGDA